MNLFERLALAAERENRDGQLPDFVVKPILEVADHPERFQGMETEVEVLLTQVEDCDPYAETGCCKFAYSVEDIVMTLRRLGIGVPGVSLPG